MDNQLKIIEAAKKAGLDPARLTASQHRLLAVQIRTTGELLRDASSVGAAILKDMVGMGVSDEVTDANLSICEQNKCGKFRRLKMKRKVRDVITGQLKVELIDGEPACDACNCQGKLLRKKCRQSNQFCPIDDPETGKPYWDNRTIQVTIGGK